MTQSAFDLAEHGANLAAAKANRLHEDWTEKALEAFRLHALKNREFTTEDVVLANPGLPEIPEKRAWGAVTNKAKRLGYVRPTDKVARSKLPNSHKRVLLVWRSTFLPLTF
jgi:hypothetical protein